MSSPKKSMYRTKMLSDSRVMSLFDLKVPEEKHIPVNLEAHLVEQKEKPETSEVSIQTDEFKKRPPTPPYVPVKTGVDASTQIESEDYEKGYIFDFDAEVEPIVNVIVYKTMEQALVEVRQEHELLSLQKQREKIEYDNNTEYLKVRWLEEKERSDWMEKEKKKEIERQRLRTERSMRKKIEAYRMSKEILESIQQDVDLWLRENQYVGSDSRSEVALDFMPWLSSQVSDRVSNVKKSSNVLDYVLMQSLEKAYKLFDNRKCWIRVLVKRRDSNDEVEEQETKKKDAPVGPIGVGPSDTVRDVLDAFESEMTQREQQEEEEQQSEDTVSINLELLYAGRVLSDEVIVLNFAKDLDLLEIREVGS